MNSSTRRLSLRASALEVAVGGIGAALYGAAIIPTATILAMVLPSPLGLIQLRPAIVIPMVIASVFGPWSGFVCGAFGNSLQIFVFGYHPTDIPGFFANGLGAIVTAILARTFARRYTGAKRTLGNIFAASVGLAWTTGLIIGFGNYLLGFAPSIQTALILVLLVAIGNSLWACTVFPPVELVVKRFIEPLSPGSQMERDK
jgi:hypothetical protein